jgi:hypothetical protein
MRGAASNSPMIVLASFLKPLLSLAQVGRQIEPHLLAKKPGRDEKLTKLFHAARDDSQLFFQFARRANFRTFTVI